MGSPHLAYYISGHGYGHAVRSAAVLKKLSQEFSVHIRTEIPESVFTLQNINHNYFSLTVDAGCAQHNFIQVDDQTTLKNYSDFNKRSEILYKNERNWLEKNNIRLIICDAPSFPLKLGKELGIPALLLSNFTWYDIYSKFPYAKNFPSLLQDLKNEYSTATVQILPQCHIENDYIETKQEIGFISLEGRNIRSQLETHFSRDFKDKILVFIYLGLLDSTLVDWSQLEKIGNVIFISRDPIQEADQINNLLIAKDNFPFPDLIASSDIVLTKAGYSTFATAFTHGKPVLSCSRENFAEYQAMEKFLLEKEVGLIIPPEKFFPGHWEEFIKKVLQITVKDKVRLNGDSEVLSITRKYIEK